MNFYPNYRHLLLEKKRAILNSRHCFASRVERTHLTLVEEALRRLDEGTFGTCQGCGEVISLRRLHAVPWARNCGDCQERRESFQPVAWMRMELKFGGRK